MAQKYALPVQWKWYSELMTTYNSLSQDTGMESDVSYHDKDWFQGKNVIFKCHVIYFYLIPQIVQFNVDY